MTSTQQALAALLREIAAWRRQRADEYDKDPRNLVTAAGLDELAAHLLALPAEDERVQALDRLLHTDGEFAPGQRVVYEAGRFRFYYPDTSLDGFLTQLVELATQDRNEHGHFAGLTPEGDDPWG
jgi:hypothetical protein